MTAWDGLGAVLLAGLLVFLVCVQIQRNMLPVRFSTLDEMNAVHDVVIWAEQQINATDPRRKRIVVLWAYGPGAPVATIMGRRMSVQDIALIAPFIDQTIAGHGRPWLLSADYEDTRPAVLGGFKARMKTQGLWPKDVRGESPTL